jgi:hypothetical protein
MYIAREIGAQAQHLTDAPKELGTQLERIHFVLSTYTALMPFNSSNGNVAQLQYA